MTTKTLAENHLIVFQNQKIRRAFYQGEWWFVVNDIISVLTDSVNVTDYLKKIRSRDKELVKGRGQIVTSLFNNLKRVMC